MGNDKFFNYKGFILTLKLGDNLTWYGTLCITLPTNLDLCKYCCIVGVCSEGELHSLLLEKYNVAVRPTKHFNSSLEVTFVLALTQIIDVVRGSIELRALIISPLYNDLNINRSLIGHTFGWIDLIIEECDNFEPADTIQYLTVDKLKIIIR